MKRYFDTVIIGLGIFFLGFGFYLVYQRSIPITTSAVESHGNPTTIIPTRVTIKDIGVDLPIYQTKIIDKKWETTRDGVSYLATSPKPGSIGNTVMYGHNWSNLLANLKNLKTGDEIQIAMNDGSTFTYTVYFITTVTPDQTHIYQNTTDQRLTLYTCTGFLDTKRLVVTAILNS